MRLALRICGNRLESGLYSIYARGGLTDGGEFGKIHNLFFDKTRKEHHGERDTTVD